MRGILSIFARIFVFGLIAISTTVSGSSSSQNTKSEVARPPLILISIDGFRADYITRGKTPTLLQLAETGVRAERMLSVFPSITMPNHQSIVTGRYPDGHGIVGNDMEDPAIGNFADTPSDPRWYSQATPIWKSAEQSGLKTESMLWPGTVTKMGGITPDHWQTYDEKLSGDERVDQVLSWFDRPTAQQPALSLLYFDIVDAAGHRFGPDSDQVNDAIASVDKSLTRLVQGLKARNVIVDYIIVSDHGMAPVSKDKIIVIDDFVDLHDGHMVQRAAVGGIMLPTGSERAAAKAALVAHHDHLTCWSKDKIPNEFHYGANPRVPDIICSPEVGWDVTDRKTLPAFEARMKEPRQYGNHGYDPKDPLMGALFVANGPDFKRGVVLPPFRNIDVYPLMTSLLKIKGETNDGSIKDVKAALNR